MNKHKQSIKHDLQKNPDELEREADSARAEVEHTLEALEEKLSPGAIFDQVVRVTRQNGGEFGSNLAAQVRSNPLPTLLVSAGLTWLMASSKRAPSPYTGNGSARSAGARVSSAVGSARNKASDLSGKARGKAADVSDTAGDAADAMRDAGSRLADSTRSGVNDLRDRWSYMNREHPLVLGALAVAAGAAVAAWLPPTDREDEWVGEASDDAKSRAKDEANRKAAEARKKAEDVADSAAQRSQAKNSGAGDSAGRDLHS